jgi:hypothetical protein
MEGGSMNNDQMNEIVFELLGHDHPVVKAIQNNEPILVNQVFVALFGMVMAELHSIDNRLEKLEVDRE